MKRFLVTTFKIILILYVVICITLYFFQEKLIFFPQKLDENYQFNFGQPFEEINTLMDDGTSVNGLLFKTENPKGLIFYLHGNAGSLSSWGDVAATYTHRHYDVFIVDYRGYGRSGGTITSERQLFRDNQTIYDKLKSRYNEDSIIVLGYSIGTGMAAKLAATNHPRLLILQAPYYSLTDMMHNKFPVIPNFILKYKFATNEYLQNCKMPVVIFHGNKDEVIYYGSSLKLKATFKPRDTLITLNGQRHNGMTENPDYVAALTTILAR